MSRKMLVLMTALCGWQGRSAAAAELNTLSGLKISALGGGAQVVVTGSRAPTFTVFRLNDPDRLVVDLTGADASEIKGHHDGSGPVEGVVASQFSGDRESVGRLLLALNKASQYDVHAEGNRVVVTVQPAGAAVEKTASPAPKKVAANVQVAPPAAEAAPSPEHVVAARVDEQKVARPAHKITSVAFAQNRLQVGTDGELARFEVIELADPPRLALDLYGVSLSAHLPKVHSRLLKEIRGSGHDGKVRIVLDMQAAMPVYRAERTAHGLTVSLESPASSAPLAQASAEPGAVGAVGAGEDSEVEIDGHPVVIHGSETGVLAVKGEPRHVSSATIEVKDLTFEDSPQGGRVQLKLSGEATYKVERPDDRGAVLTLEGAKLPKRLERSLDTSALDTPVKMISAFAVPGNSERVRVVVAGNGALDETVVKTATGLSWRLSVKGVKTEEVAVSVKTAGFSSEAARFAEQGAPQRVQYNGKKVSFEFKDIEIHNLLRIIAEVSKKNIVVADDVSGKVTIRLRNVPWDQALEYILRSKGLGKEDLGNIVRVAPLKALEEEAKLRESRKKSMQQQEDLVVQLIPVNYATASDMKDRVKDVLSDRGTVTVDARTNVMIVKDVKGSIERARSLVQNLDTQTPQVLIESRIVEANTTFSKQVGVQWGGAAQMAPGTGNPTGLVFPNSVAVRGGSESSSNTGTSNNPNFAVNLPAAVGAGSGGALGFIFGSAGGALALNLRLSALENQGTVKTISAPKVTTLDNSPARISQGISIPFSQTSASGVNTSFIEARLLLDVTPHITQDGSILMNIKAENNQPDPSSTGANGQPAIQRKEANTQVLVKDGDTTVIGGIYVRRGSSSSSMVPFFGRIPLLGFFFRNHTEADTRQELLIFITPRIINRQTIAQNL